MDMVTIGSDSHKHTHTVVAVNDNGQRLAERTVPATGAGHLELLRWSARFEARTWALEDCRHLSRRLESDLLRAGERVLRVPPRLMAGARRSGRQLGKSDPIDALAVARAALREPDLPIARLDGPERELRLLIDHREDLIAERTRVQNRLRWHLHELVADIRSLTERINRLEREIAALAERLAPSLLTLTGCGPLTAAKIVGETAGVGRFRSRAAFARHNGTAPVPVWSGNTVRHRLSRGGNRQLNAGIHRIAITQLQRPGPGRDYLEHRQAAGDTKSEAIRALRRRISDEVYRRLHADELTRIRQPDGLAAAA